MLQIASMPMSILSKRPSKLAARSGVYPRIEPEPPIYRVRPDPRGWAVFAEGRAMPMSVHPTRDAAIGLADALAYRAHARVVIHDEDDVFAGHERALTRAG